MTAATALVATGRSVTSRPDRNPTMPVMSGQHATASASFAFMAEVFPASLSGMSIAPSVQALH